MKYHPEILYANYHFVRRVDWHLKIKKKCSEMVKNRPKSAKCALSMVLLSGRCHGNACRINEVLVLVLIEETCDCFKE